MDYCLRYSNKCKVMQKTANEISIRYDENYRELPAFLEAHPNQRIIVNVMDIEADNEFKLLNAIYEKYNNFVLCFVGRLSNYGVEIPADNKIPYFYDRHINNWEELHYVLNKGVSDVYITDDLCFNLPAVHKICAANGVRVRVFPNVAQSKVPTSNPRTKFFIRPEDIDYYAPYIDVLEFWGELSKQDVYYHIYAESKEWFGDLNEIIIDLNTSIDNRAIVPYYAKWRLTCRKKCLEGFNCRICSLAADIAQKLTNKNLVIRTRKTKKVEETKDE